MENIHQKKINILKAGNENQELYKLRLVRNKLKNLKKEVKKILFIQPLQIEEEKIDIKIALNKRYYMYPPYGIGILNKILKNNY
jgi:hypothetical protein